MTVLHRSKATTRYIEARTLTLLMHESLCLSVVQVLVSVMPAPLYAKQSPPYSSHHRFPSRLQPLQGQGA